MNIFSFLAEHFDLPILDWIATYLWNPVLDAVMPVITLLGDAGIFWIALAAIFLFIPKYRKTGLSMGVALVMGLVMGLFMRPLLGIYSPNPAVIDAGVIRLRVFAATYFICGIMDVFCGMLRGMGQAVAPMVVSVMGACVFRTVWIYTVLVAFPSLNTLYLSYPISWILTGGVHLLCYFRTLRRFPVTHEVQPVQSR